MRTYYVHLNQMYLSVTYILFFLVNYCFVKPSDESYFLINPWILFCEIIELSGEKRVRYLVCAGISNYL